MRIFSTGNFSDGELECDFSAVDEKGKLCRFMIAGSYIRFGAFRSYFSLRDCSMVPIGIYVYLDVDFMTGYNVRSYLLLSITLTCIGLYLFWEIKSYGAVTLRPDTF